MGASIITDLLGGAERVRPRARGFADWSPRAETLALLARVNAVLGEYADHLPLTLRQIFYRLVGAHGYEKTEQAYERLGEHLVRARRARLIQMDAIRDDGGTVMRPTMWESAEEYLAAVRARAGRLMLDRAAGQGGRHGAAACPRRQPLRHHGHVVGRLRQRHREAQVCRPGSKRRA